LENKEKGVDEEEHLLRKDIIVYCDEDGLKDIVVLPIEELDHI